MAGWGWHNWQNDAGWKWRLTVSVPMSFLSILDNLVSLLTLGYVMPGMALDFAYHRAMKRAGKEQA